MLDDQPAPEGKETKHERFLRLAPLRVQNALRALDIVSKLGSRQNDFSEEEATRIIEALRARVDTIERLLLHTDNEKTPFSFE